MPAADSIRIIINNLPVGQSSTQETAADVRASVY
jgi:hypothetical protein